MLFDDQQCIPLGLAPPPPLVLEILHPPLNKGRFSYSFFTWNVDEREYIMCESTNEGILKQPRFCIEFVFCLNFGLWCALTGHCYFSSCQPLGELIHSFELTFFFLLLNLPLYFPSLRTTSSLNLNSRPLRSVPLSEQWNLWDCWRIWKYHLRLHLYWDNDRWKLRNR